MTPAATRRCHVFRLPAAHPADVSGVMALIASGTIQPSDIRAIFGKTEGNGCVNDFSRAFAVSAFQSALAPPLGCSPAEVGQRIAMVMSGGTEGGLSPHFLLFTVTAAPPYAPPNHSLAIGTAFTRTFQPRRLGRMAQVEATAEAVAAAMEQAGIARARRRPLRPGQMPAADRRTRRRTPPQAATPSPPPTPTSRWATPAAPPPSASPSPCNELPAPHSTTASSATGSIYGPDAPAPPPASN